MKLPPVSKLDHLRDLLTKAEARLAASDHRSPRWIAEVNRLTIQLRDAELEAAKEARRA